MDDKEAIRMMQRCIHDIRDLRRQVDVLAPKAEAIVWTLERKIRELQSKPAEIE